MYSSLFEIQPKDTRFNAELVAMESREILGNLSKGLALIEAEEKNSDALDGVGRSVLEFALESFDNSLEADENKTRLEWVISNLRKAIAWLVDKAVQFGRWLQAQFKSKIIGDTLKEVKVNQRVVDHYVTQGYKVKVKKSAFHTKFRDTGPFKNFIMDADNMEIAMTNLSARVSQTLVSLDALKVPVVGSKSFIADAEKLSLGLDRIAAEDLLIQPNLIRNDRDDEGLYKTLDRFSEDRVYLEFSLHNALIFLHMRDASIRKDKDKYDRVLRELQDKMGKFKDVDNNTPELLAASKTLNRWMALVQLTINALSGLIRFSEEELCGHITNMIANGVPTDEPS